MRYTLIGKLIDLTPEERAFFDSKIEKLDRLIPTFSDELVSLQATIEKNLKRGDYSTALSLHFPQQPFMLRNKAAISGEPSGRPWTN